MNTSNATADRSAKPVAEKGHEKLAEKRRALGRGLESLLPGPRVVVAVPPVPPNVRKDGAPLPASPTGVSTPPAGSSVANEGSEGTAVASQDGVATPASANVHSVQASAEPVADGAVFQLDLDQIDLNPYQTRTEFEPRAMNDLAGSIQMQGVLQPIVVRPQRPEQRRPDGADGADGKDKDKDRFILILGERRYRASKLVGKTTIPAILKRVSEQQAAEMTLVENLQREDLDCLDQALAFAKLATEFKMTQEEIGKRVGVSREQVSNYLRLLRLPPEVQTMLRQKELSFSHARLLLSLNDEKQISNVARVVIAKKMSVALLEEMVVDSHAPAGDPSDTKRGVGRWVDPNVKAAQRSLEAILGMKVSIRDRRGQGKITIEYGTLEDFDRVVGMLKGK
jgi:ParB family transcriptional regulator, chromosome partitioning protein